MHFITSNYLPFKKRKEFSLLVDENLKHVEEHQWPPVSYLEAAKVYEKEMQAYHKTEKCSIM